ncbi:hypothetical protein L218DRAFT_392701 [Marasmius fiardii PR-910]|nr:hypothetical protein L218DRAFT_392701 [Marasmius fiardii PR-910]
MLRQIPRMTEPCSQSVLEVFPSFRSAMDAYGKAGLERRNGEKLLEDCPVSRREDGRPRKTGTRLGPALSKRVHTVQFGQDPLELVDKEHK